VFREFLQQLTFGHRLVLYRLLIALFIAGMIYYAFYVPKEGDRAMLRAAEAMRQAKSWKVEYVRELPQVEGRMEVVEEVACPSNSRSTLHQTQRVEGTMREWTNVDLRIGNASYVYNSVAGRWTLNAPYGGGAQAICQAVARGDDTQSLPSLSAWARRALVSKGDRRDTGLGSCQEWKITIPRHNASPEKASVCLGEDDNLPRIVTQYGQETRYSDWNLPVEFRAPEITEQRRP
jgi:hypothetical protein